MSQIAIEPSGVSSFNFSFCRLMDDDVSEDHGLIRKSVAAHTNLILYFTCYRTFGPEDFAALPAYCNNFASYGAIENICFITNCYRILDLIIQSWCITPMITDPKIILTNAAYDQKSVSSLCGTDVF